MKCCGVECQTAFCPTCGAGSNEPLAGLLAHCRKHLTLVQNGLADYRLRSDEDPDHYPRSRLRQRETVVARWEHWCEALDVAIALAIQEST